MKNKFSFVITYLCLLALLMVGVGELLFAEKEAHQSHKEGVYIYDTPEILGPYMNTGGAAPGHHRRRAPAHGGPLCQRQRSCLRR